MSIKSLTLALALLAPVAAQATEPAPKAECCCCEKGAEGKMKCCDKMKGDDKEKSGDHSGHDMSGMDHH